VGERIEPMDTDTPLQMIPAKAFAEVPDPFAVIVPGRGAATIHAMKDESTLAYVRSAAETAEVVGSTGNGALILAAAGSLEGRRAAIHWAYGELLESLGAKYAQERWVEDGKFLTSAGGSAGIDMMLYLASRLTDVATARRVQLAIDYDPQPPFGRLDWAHVSLLPRVMRGGISLAAPVISAKPKSGSQGRTGGYIRRCRAPAQPSWQHLRRRHTQG
jgi:transcriptional regulator GlxA family with amidase domain